MDGELQSESDSDKFAPTGVCFDPSRVGEETNHVDVIGCCSALFSGLLRSLRKKT